MSKLLGSAETFEGISREWYQRYVTSLSTKHARRILAYLETYLFPCIGQRLINVITAHELVTVLRRIATSSPQTAHRLRSVCNQIFRYAFQVGLIEGSPVDELRGTLPRVIRKSFSAPDAKDIGPILKAVDGYKGSKIVRAAMQLAPLVIARPEQLRLAEWVEMDLAGMKWTIPAERSMRMMPHVVPLSAQALSILRELYKTTGTDKYVFASPTSPHRCIGAGAINGALRTIGNNITGYSFRKVGVQILYEILGVRPELIEIQLGYVKRTSRHVLTHTRLEERREMMQQLADYLDAVRGEQKVPASKLTS